MTSSTTKASHPRVRCKIKQDFVFETLRNQILSGKYPPGSKLPFQAELTQSFQVSGQTIQQAMQRLAREGVVLARRRVGTVVASKLPHLHNLALVLPHDPVSGDYFSRFFTVLSNSARYLQNEQERPINVFHNINRHSDVEDRQRLLDLINAHQLAGIIFATTPFLLEGTPILEQNGIPRVAIMATATYPQLPAIAFDMQSFIRRAFDHLQSRGRRRIAVLAPPELVRQMGRLETEAANRGLRCPPHWQQLMPQHNAVGACNCVRLLMQGPAESRPDGLMILDDNLVDHALAGLIAEQIRVPTDLELVVHCNFPWPPVDVMPVTRLGFDSREVLRQCIQMIDKQRRGEAVSGLTTIPAVFEQELAVKPTEAHVETAA